MLLPPPLLLLLLLLLPQATLAALAPWGVVVLLSLAFIETYRLAALWGEEDFEKRAYPGGVCWTAWLAARLAGLGTEALEKCTC